MSIAPLPANEVARLQSLHDLRVLDTGPEAQFDALVKVASLVCGVPISLISLIDAERQWFKANIGLPGTSETPRDLAFCAHAILEDTIFEVSDAALDPRFSDNPLVTAYPDIRFYAGAPVRLSNGECVGTLCVIDRQPRRLDAQQRDILTQLACAAARALEGRRALAAERHLLDAQAHVNSLLRESKARFRALSDASPLGVFAADAHGHCTYANARWQTIFGLTGAQSLGPGWMEAVVAQDRVAVQEALRRTAASGVEFDQEFRVPQADGAMCYVHARACPILGPDNAVSSVVGAVIDVTQRKISELALEAARERELAIGYSVQQSLLMADVPSELNGAWITAYTEPSQGLHGDFIAVSQISSTRFSLLIGDVMGKGVHAAMIGAGVKNAYYQVLAELTAQTLASQVLPSAGGIINALHARMTPKLIEMNSFVTLALYAFDIEAGTLTVVNAGHTPALLARAGSGAVEMIQGSNLPIGVLASEIYTQHVVQIAVNDQLVIYSDGISEVRNTAGEEFGEARISAWLADVGAADVPQAAALNTLRQARADFGSCQRMADDQTVLMVRLRPHDLPVRETPAAGHNPDYLTLPMRLGALPALRARLAQVTAQWPRVQADELILATYEAATNTIRHTPTSLPEAYLACRFTTDQDSLCVEFFYPGAPVVLDETCGPDFSGASESGFGLYIMREFLDQIEYGVPVEGMVSVRLRKRLTPPVQA